MKFKILFTFLVMPIVILVAACGNSLLVEPERGSPANQQKTPLPNPTFTPTITKVIAVSLYTPQPLNPNATKMSGADMEKQRLPNPTATSTITPVIAIQISPTSTSTTTEIVDIWESYIDEEAGYSFLYKPNEGRLNVSRRPVQGYHIVDITFINQPEIHEYQAMYIFVLPNPEYLSLDDFLRVYYQEKYEEMPLENLVSFTEAITIAGHSASKTTLFSSQGSTYAFHVFIPNGDKVYMTGPTYGTVKGTKVHTQTVEQFYQILENFRILE